MPLHNNIIYLVDDEPSITEVVQFALEREGFVVKVFNTGQTCLVSLETDIPVLILLDIGLMDGSGFDFFRKIRDFCETPIIFLTARSEEIDRVVGLEMGADDYIVKPFSLRELVARVRVVLRRVGIFQGEIAPKTISLTSPFLLDEVRKEIRYHGVKLILTMHEFKLLQILLAQPGRVFSRAQLLEKAWESPEHRLERTIDTHIKSLRLKLREIAINEDPIRTSRGMGYSLVIDQ